MQLADAGNNDRKGPTMKVYTIAIQKGGAGKTTTAAALAQAAVFRGRRVLAIDLDPQGNLSFFLDVDTNGKGAADFLNGTDPAEILQKSPQGMDVIPASRSLATVTTGRGTARRLQKALLPLKDKYGVVIIDTTGDNGELLYNALQASDGLIIPIEADIYNVQSLYQTTETARQIQGSNPALSFTGLIFTKYDGRSTITRQMKETITERGAALGVPFLGEIRAAVAMKEAAALQQSIFRYAPKAKPAQDYLALYDRITADKE